jgi:hypothetical protein
MATLPKHSIPSSNRRGARAHLRPGWPWLGIVTLCSCIAGPSRQSPDTDATGELDLSEGQTTSGTATTSHADTSGAHSDSEISDSSITNDDESSEDPGDDSTFEQKFDLAIPPDLGDDESSTGECEVEHVPCDADSDDPWHAMGLNCPGEISVEGSYAGLPLALAVTGTPIGTNVPTAWPVLEGEKLVVLSTGVANDIFKAGAFDYGTGFPPDDEKLDLPAPIVPVSVAGDCLLDPTLIGTGDCSRTLAAEWMEAGEKKGNDYAELRLTLKVPPRINGFAFDFAFFSGEYPRYFSQRFNDFFVVWLESKLWTGNISFDDAGHPISLNAGFLDYKDGGEMGTMVDPACPAPCLAPELEGTGCQGHAATRWLTTSAAVEPGETITLVFAVVDLADGILDAAVLLDNFRWTCFGHPPQTNPK